MPWCRVALEDGGGPQLPPFAPCPSPFPPSPAALPGSSPHGHVPEPVGQQRREPPTSPALLPQFPSLAERSAPSPLQGPPRTVAGTLRRSCGVRSPSTGGSPLPRMPRSPLPALQPGSGLRRWLREAFFPRCNFFLLHKVCFEQCLEASHPPLGCRGGRMQRGCKWRRGLWEGSALL